MKSWLDIDAAYSYVFCPNCSRLLRGRVLRGPEQLTWVKVPAHYRKRLVVTLEPRREYL